MHPNNTAHPDAGTSAVLYRPPSRARAGGLVAETLVWKDGMPDWDEAGRVPVLAALLPSDTPAGDASPPPRRDPGPDRFGEYLIGSWELTASIGGVNESTSIDFSPDGRYEGAISSANEHGGADSPVAVAVSGQWEASGLGGERFTLMLKPNGDEPPRSATFRIVDEDTLFNESAQASAYRISP